MINTEHRSPAEARRVTRRPLEAPGALRAIVPDDPADADDLTVLRELLAGSDEF